MHSPFIVFDCWARKNNDGFIDHLVDKRAAEKVVTLLKVLARAEDGKMFCDSS